MSRLPSSPGECCCLELGPSGGAGAALPIPGPSHEEEGFQKAPHWVLHQEDLLGPHRQANGSRTMKLPILNHCLRRASSPGSSHAAEVVTCSWVCSCVSRGSAHVWIEKRSCHLALHAEVSKKKKSTHTKPKVSAPSVLFCLSLCCSRQGCWGAGRLLLQPGCRNCCWELQGSCGQE